MRGKSQASTPPMPGVSLNDHHAIMSMTAARAVNGY